MQQHGISRSRPVQRPAQSFEIGRAVRARMLEGSNLKADIGKDLRVVGPAGHAHQHALHTGLLYQRQGQANRARAPRRLHTLDPAMHGCILAEDVGHQRMHEAHVALRPEIGLAVLFGEQLTLRRFDGREHRGRTVVRAIDADTQIYLPRPRVIGVHLDEREERVGGLRV